MSDLKAWSRWLVLPAIVVLTIAVLGTVRYAGAAGGDPFCNQDTSQMPGEKRSFLQRYCASIAQVAPPGLKSKGTMPRVSTSRQDEGGPLFGVIEGLPLPKWLLGNFARGNEWLSDRYIVYAGSLRSDPNQGVVVLATRFEDSTPKELGRYLAPGNTGVLRVQDANGAELTLVAANGDRYTFNLEQRSLSRK